MALARYVQDSPLVLQHEFASRVLESARSQSIESGSERARRWGGDSSCLSRTVDSFPSDDTIHCRLRAVQESVDSEPSSATSSE